MIISLDEEKSFEKHFHDRNIRKLEIQKRIELLQSNNTSVKKPSANIIVNDEH